MIEYHYSCSLMSLKHFLILKIRKLKSVGGCRSTVDAEAIDTEVIDTVDPGVDQQLMQRQSTLDPGGGSMIDIEVIDAEVINT